MRYGISVKSDITIEMKQFEFEEGMIFIFDGMQEIL